MSRQLKKNLLSRKEFLRLAAAGLGAAALSGCQPEAGGPAVPVSSPTTSPLPSDTPEPPPTNTAVPSPSATSTIEVSPTPLKEVYRPDLVKIYPAVASKVVEAHHAGAWSGTELVPNVLRRMLDDAITRLTGLAGAREAWSALFLPEERIAIKVNAFGNSTIWTHVPLVAAVTDSLVEAGIPAEHITIYDQHTYELMTAGFNVNPDGPGVRCAGTDDNVESSKVQVIDREIQLSNILVNCDALINMPVLKSHMMAGITFAMKNHYGSYQYPELLHSPSMEEVAALNALPHIKDRTRLIIGDALAANLRYRASWPYWVADWTGDSIFMSFDPVAHDTLGLQKLSKLLEADGESATAINTMASPALDYGTRIGIGTRDLANIQFEEVWLS